MKSMYRNNPFRTAVSYLSIGLLATSSLAFGQNSTAPAPGQSANPSGGWRRVGDPAPQEQANPPADPSYSSNQGPGVNLAADDPNQAPPPPADGPNYGPAPSAQQQPSYPQGAYQQGPYQPGPYQQGPYQQGPYQQGPYQQGPYQQGPNQQPTYQQSPYPQQPYRPPNYNQQQAYPPAPSPVPAQVTIPAGTFLTVRVNQMLSSDRNEPGDAFSATLVEPVVANGVVVADRGQTIGGRVALVQKHAVGQPARLGVQLTTLTLVDGQQVPVNSQLTSRRGGTTPGGVEAGTVVATTGLGAAIGAAAGWGTGAAIGAGAGALAGIIGAVVTHNHASVIYPEQVLTFRLETPITISTQNSPMAFRYVQPGEYDRPNAPPMYAGAGMAPAPMYAAAPYPYYPYGSYWGPSFSFYYGPGYWWGGHYFYRPIYRRR
jgi:hypothetical protein